MVFQQTQAIDELHKQTTLMGTQLQHTQLHLNQVDASVPAATTIGKVLLSIVTKVNKVVSHMRSVEPVTQRSPEKSKAVLEISPQWASERVQAAAARHLSHFGCVVERACETKHWWGRGWAMPGREDRGRRAQGRVTACADM